MRFSIVTAVRNRRSVIERCLDSVAHQSFDSIEHVIVDGASIDGTTEVILDRLSSYHVKTVMSFSSAPDLGIYDALNEGIQRAKGEIIGVLHSDDVFADSDVLSRVNVLFKDPNVDMVFGDLVYVDPEDPEVVVRKWISGEFRPGKLRFGWMPPHPTVFVRKAVLDRYGLYDQSYKISGDYDALLRWMRQPGFRAAYLPEVMVKMSIGGISNKSLRNILHKSLEDMRAIRSNSIGGFFTLVCKNASKITQFSWMGK